MICFALLAHEDEGALRQQIKNIRKYNPKDAFIVFYNGGPDRDFGKKVCREENVLYCPYSKPLTQRSSGRFFYDVMRWLEERKIRYEYLVYLEYDIMFVGRGFREMLESRMKGYDCLLKFVKKETDPQKATWDPAKLMWAEWKDWRPFFHLDHFFRTSSPMSVYRHGIVRKMLAGINRGQIERLFRSTHIRCLGEMIYVTLAKKYGARCLDHRNSDLRYLRFRPELTLREVQDAKRRPDVMFVHPVKNRAVMKWIWEH
ncbi:hypothetical protein [Paenibacillus sedimenti]|uniref:Uncharacterized protein n=1 Tax=Paenibacillus sedimenti TaxID=2770274 RepID=A0A926QJD3_9BACL|nr:hypothetical protein [Paenibacillus sedimenti]MBD0381581.1 hypothetical protein [Paenibacillus sedimenti]